MKSLKEAVKYFSILMLLLSVTVLYAQNGMVNYSPCFLKDSVDKKLPFIRQNAAMIFTETADCKDLLLDSIAMMFARTRDIRYISVLTIIHKNPLAKTNGLFTDAVMLLAEYDFTWFINQLYLGKGKYQLLQNELIAAMNMIIDGKPLKQKYTGRLNAEIERAKASHDENMEEFLEKLKMRIEGDQYR
jgi:hypothetical protein